MANDGISFQCIDFNCMLYDEVFYIYCEKYYECMKYRHACVNIQN